jgi:hypothetical protein
LAVAFPLALVENRGLTANASPRPQPVVAMCQALDADPGQFLKPPPKGDRSGEAGPGRLTEGRGERTVGSPEAGHYKYPPEAAKSAMPVHAQLAALKILQVVFEVRYDEGYRYLDRCGETLVRIRKYNPSWIPGSTDPQRSVVTNHEQQLALNIGNESLIVTTIEELDSTGMGKKIEVLSKEAESLYKIIVESLNVPNTVRVGLRCRFIAPADTLEEANRFITRAASSPMLDALRTYTKFEPRSASMLYVLEDPESGLRKRIEFSAVARVQVGGPPITGLATDTGSGGIVVDVDSFTRPERGHLSKAGMFIQENYSAARELALHAFEWLKQHQHRR